MPVQSQPLSSLQNLSQPSTSVSFPSSHSSTPEMTPSPQNWSVVVVARVVLVVELVVVEVVVVLDVEVVVEVLVVVLVVEVVVVVPATHWFAMHVLPKSQGPQSIGDPHPSPAVPHWAPTDAHDCGEQHTPNLSDGSTRTQR
jgi:hypothetical protein